MVFKPMPVFECEVPNCTNRGQQIDRICNRCKARWQRAGGPLAPIRKRAVSIDSNGYARVNTAHKLFDGRRSCYEHIRVMEEILGRRLIKGENVHHKNGNRSDNRPENLELWNTTQPPGQRVEDKLNWAREIVALYGAQPEV